MLETDGVDFSRPSGSRQGFKVVSEHILTPSRASSGQKLYAPERFDQSSTSWLLVPPDKKKKK